MNKRIKRIGGEAIWVIAGQLLVITGSLALVKVITGRLSPEEYGFLALAMTIVAFGQTVTFGGFRSAIIRFYSNADKTERFDAYVRSSKRTVLLISSMWVSILILISLLLFIFGQDYAAVLVLISAPYSAIVGIFSALVAFNSAGRKRRLVATHQGAETWLKVSMILAMGYFFDTSVSSIIISYALSTLIACLSLLRFSLKGNLIQSRGSDHSSQEIQHEMVKYSAPFYLWGPFVWAQQAADKWSLAMFSSTEVIGYYAVTLQLTFAPMRIFVSMFTQFFSPIFFAKLNETDGSGENIAANRFLFRLIGVALIGVFVAFLASLMLHKSIFDVLVAEEYSAASKYLPWLLLSAGLVATGQLISLRILGERETGLLLAPQVVSSIVGLVLIISGAAFFGIIGVIGAHLIFGVLQVVWIFKRALRLG